MYPYYFLLTKKKKKRIGKLHFLLTNSHFYFVCAQPVENPNKGIGSYAATILFLPNNGFVGTKKKENYIKPKYKNRSSSTSQVNPVCALRESVVMTPSRRDSEDRRSLSSTRRQRPQRRSL